MIKQKKPRGNFENSTTDPVINPNDALERKQEIEASRRSPLYLYNNIQRKKGDPVLTEKEFLDMQREKNASTFQKNRDNIERKILEKEGIELIDDTV